MRSREAVPTWCAIAPRRRKESVMEPGPGQCHGQTRVLAQLTHGISNMVVTVYQPADELVCGQERGRNNFAGCR